MQGGNHEGEENQSRSRHFDVGKMPAGDEPDFQQKQGEHAFEWSIEKRGDLIIS